MLRLRRRYHAAPVLKALRIVGEYTQGGESYSGESFLLVLFPSGPTPAHIDSIRINYDIEENGECYE